MAGRKPTLNWTKSRGQYTVTVAGKFHLLGSDKDEAERKYRYLLNMHDLGEPVEANPTFADIADRWLEHVRADHTPERYRNCKSRMEEFVTFIGEKAKVRDIRPRHVEGWMATKTGVKKPGTIRLYKSTILRALNWAASKRVRLIPSNPLKGLLELPEGESRGGDVVWSQKVFEMVVKHANPAFADVVRIMAWTGARPSTICLIEARHFLPHLKLWDVEDMYKNRKSHVKYVKRIWLFPQAVALVNRLNKLYPEGPIFRNSAGTPWTPQTLGVYMYQMQHKFKPTKDLDWPESVVCLYGLRHTFATNFIKQCPERIEYLRELLGHRDLKMIRKHYGHLYDEHEAIHAVLSGMKMMGDESVTSPSC